MPFPFTFKLAVPGLNPFSSPAETPPQPPQSSSGYISQSPEKPRSRPARPNNINQRRPSPSPSPAPPSSRKRGWDPSLAEPSQSTATLTSSSGYLDTPAKYREMVALQTGDEFELEDMTASVSDLPPPAKRRRGLAGSIVSTAVSAALIGTAVGLTVYRLWRDRGKDAEPEQLPPPPYQKGEWSPVQQPQAIEITPPTPMITPRRRKVRHGTSTASANKRHNHRARPRTHGRAFSPPSNTMSSPHPPFSSDAVADEDGTAVEDKMDWIGDQLSMLIQEGQKALGREIVIKSDAREDEVDDGCGVWEEEEGGYDQEFGGPSSYQNSVSRSASPRQRKRPRNLTLAPPSYASRPPSASPRATRFEFTSASLPSSAGARWRSDAPPNIRGVSTESLHSGRDEEETWESPELKESMARARARLLGMRGAG
ncbi:hypothetical protein B0H19DRAFT_1189055 [Mycena capillaripes]|nr:hypothetical protein B0H19DRAFT_1189055 [Mycena capillaripes]